MITWSPENAEMAKIKDALVRAARTAREDARRLGLPVAIWKDGKVVLEKAAQDPSPSPDQR